MTTPTSNKKPRKSIPGGTQSVPMWEQSKVADVIGTIVMMTPRSQSFIVDRLSVLIGAHKSETIKTEVKERPASVEKPKEPKKTPVRANKLWHDPVFNGLAVAHLLRRNESKDYRGSEEGKAVLACLNAANGLLIRFRKAGGQDDQIQYRWHHFSSLTLLKTAISQDHQVGDEIAVKTSDDLLKLKKLHLNDIALITETDVSIHNQNGDYMFELPERKKKNKSSKRKAEERIEEDPLDDPSENESPQTEIITAPRENKKPKKDP